MTVKYGKLHIKDNNGDLYNIVVDATGGITEYEGATSTANGVAGLVPPATSSEYNKFLRGDGTWQTVSTGGGGGGGTYDVATQTTNGLMSSTDKIKLDSINLNTLPTNAVATTSANGLMSSTDKTKLDSLDSTTLVTLTGSQVITGTKQFSDVYNTHTVLTATSGEVEIDGTSSVYSFTVSTHTDIVFDVSLTSGQSKVFTLIINYNPSSNYIVYWPTNIYWASGTPPTLYDKNVITFLGIYNSSTNKQEWYGTVSVSDAQTESGVGTI